MDNSFVDTITDKLLKESVLFFVGAGLSLNWGFPSGRQLAEWLAKEAPLAPDQQLMLRGVAPSLPEVAEILGTNKGYLVRELFYRRRHKPPNRSNFFKTADELTHGRDALAAGDIGVPHIVFGRLAKEELIREVMTINYDCLIEAGCLAVGMVENRPDDGDVWRYRWPETYRAVADEQDIFRAAPGRHVFHIYKIHGCIAKLHQVMRHVETKCPPSCDRHSPCSECPLTQDHYNFVITYRELVDWRDDRWARDLFYDRVRTHHVVFTGIHGADSVLHASLRRVYDEVWESERKRKQQAVQIPPIPPSSPSLPSPGAVLPEDTGLALAEQAASWDHGNGRESKVVRAQTTEFDPNFYMRQIVRTASGGTIRENAIWSLKNGDTPRGRVEKLFRSTYASTLRQLLLRQIQWHWIPWAEEALHEEGNERSDKNPLELAAQAGTLLAETVRLLTAETFWYKALPSALRLSWAWGDTQMPWEEAFMRRLALPNYYVPFGPNHNFALPLTAFYAFLWGLGRDLHWTAGPWVLLRLNGGAQRLLLPVVAPRGHLLARRLSLPLTDATPPVHLLRSGLVKPLLVFIGSQHGARVKHLATTAGAGGSLGQRRIRSTVLSYHQLVNGEAFKAWVDQLQLDDEERGN